MTDDFECLRCPMCSGELIYSEGTHDLCCKNNTLEIANTEAPKRKGSELMEKKDFTLHESRDGYGYGSADEFEEEPCEVNASQPGESESARNKEPRSMDRALNGKGFLQPDTRAPEKSKDTRTCVFGISFTESGRNGTLWSVRTVHGGTDYFSLMRLLDKIEKRQRRREPLAANVPNLPKKVERSEACKLAFRYSVDVEDLYSIKYSSETVVMLALYYGLSERDIRHIKSAEVGEE